jgi:hypothetical protein
MANTTDDLPEGSVVELKRNARLGAEGDPIPVVNTAAGGEMNGRCGVMHNVFLGITCAGVLVLVFASLVALQRIIE